MLEDFLKYLKSNLYDINIVGGNIVISDKKTLFIIAEINVYRLNEALRRQKNETN